MRFTRYILCGFICLSLTLSWHDGAAAKGRKSGRKVGKGAGTVDLWQRVRGGLRIPTLGATYQGIEALAVIASQPRKKLLTANNSDSALTSSSAENPDLPQGSRLTTTITPQRTVSGESQLLEKFRPRQQQAILAKNSGLYKKDISQNKYTELGRKRLGSKIEPAAESNKSANNELAAKDAKIGKSPVIERIRTRLNFHPELAKHNVGGVNITTTPIGGTLNGNGQNQLMPTVLGRCADLGATDTLHLAQQGLLPESYRVLLDQCRQKRSEIYERVNRQIAGFTGHIGFVNDSAERARPFLFHVVDMLTKHGLPLDLALLPIVESGYQATALSPASAAGIWQFIPSTGRIYGLEQNEYYDGRLDVTSATHAAVRFLSGLRDHYRGDWLLALAAYNCGPGNVDAAIAKNLAAGLDTDYWSLALPQETQNYVPRLLALSTMFSNPGHYGLRLRPVKNQLHFVKVDIVHPMDIGRLGSQDLPSIAKLANLSTQELTGLNTAYIKSIINKNEPFSLLMPIANANQLHQTLVYLAKSDQQRQTVYQHDFFLVDENAQPSAHSLWPKIDQPLLMIALEQSQPSPAIRQFGQNQAAIDDDPDEITPWPKDYSAVHYLDFGETLKTVAENYGISEAKLKEINKFKRKQKAVTGQRLFIPIEQFANSSQPAVRSVLFKAGTAGAKG